LDSMNEESQIISTPCGHIFHRECVEIWMNTGEDSCPQCRRPIRREEIHPAFMPRVATPQELRKLRAKAGNDKLQMDKVVSERDDLKSKNAALRAKVANAKLLMDKEKLISNLEKEVSELKSKNAAEHDGLKSKIAVLRAKVANDKLLMDKVVSERDGLKSKNAAEHDVLKSKNAALRAKAANAKLLMDKVVSERDGLKLKIAAEHHGLKSKNVALRAKAANVAKEKIDEKEAESEAANSEVAVLKKTRIPRYLGLPRS